LLGFFVDNIVIKNEKERKQRRNALAGYNTNLTAIYGKCVTPMLMPLFNKNLCQPHDVLCG
jgi:hypothetical protein